MTSEERTRRVDCCNRIAEYLCLGTFLNGVPGSVYRCGECHRMIRLYDNGRVIIDRQVEEPS